MLREFFDDVLNPKSAKNVLIVQCECGHFNQELITCARFTIVDEYSKYISESESAADLAQRPFYIFLIIQIPKIAGGCISGFQTSKWYVHSSITTTQRV